MRALLLAAVLVAAPVASAAPASAGPCLPERYCPPCPYVVTLENGKPKIEQAQC